MTTPDGPSAGGVPVAPAVPVEPTFAAPIDAAALAQLMNAMFHGTDAGLPAPGAPTADLAAGMPAAGSPMVPPSAAVPVGVATPGAAALPATSAASPGPESTGMQLGLPGQLPIDADFPPFMIPKEIELVPEPRDLHKSLGAPTPPAGIEHDNEATKPYWLSARATGMAAESAAQPIAILPIDIDLEPTQVVANLPDPPKRPPPQPPSKDWSIGKLVTMSGQAVSREAKTPDAPSTPVSSGGGPYWLPSSSGLKHGETSTAKSGAPSGHFDVESVRKDFPILKQKVNGKPLVWLDNAATTQKPQQVIDRISQFYATENSNIHRAAHELAARATDAFEAAREKVRRFLGAGSVGEIVFTRGTTESINLVAQSYGGSQLNEGDEIILTRMEHHSNIVPWQHIARVTGARIRVVPFFDNGEIDLGAYERLFNRRTRIVGMTHVSNALGSVLPVADMVATAHRHGAVALVDGAQSVPHFPVNVQDMDADFYVLSGHKLFGPTGIGVLYGKKALLEAMPPWQGGGNMIESVSFERTIYNPPPSKFEAGTGILAGAVGLGAAIDYLERIGFLNAARYEHELLEYGQEQLRRLKGVKLIGEAREKAGVMSFISDRVSPSEMGEILNAEGIAVRTGHHCAQPALAHYGLSASIRPSLAFYNTRDEIDLLIATVKRAIESRS